jgi:hypothetical protein
LLIVSGIGGLDDAHDPLGGRLAKDGFSLPFPASFL